MGRAHRQVTIYSPAQTAIVSNSRHPAPVSASKRSGLVSDNATNQELKSMMRTTRRYDTESSIHNTLTMMLLFPICRFALLMSTSLCAASSLAQEGPSTLLAKQGIDVAKGASPCFDAPDSAVSKQLENEALAGLPELARFWLTEDVAFIISPEERSAFLHLGTDQERDQFIEQFWSRRAPDPTSLDNSFKREHYERIVAANQKFSDQVPGWKTDRGRLYVMCGPPDAIESHRSGEKTGRPPDEGVKTDQYEVWHYRHIDGVGDNVEIKFVDPSGSGDYRLSLSPDIKDEVIFDPPHNLGRNRRGEGTARSADVVELFVGALPSPQVQFKDLEAVVSSHLIREQVQFTHRIEFVKATDATTFTAILVSLPSNHPNSPSNIARSPGEFEVFGRVSKSSGRIVDTFERRISLTTQNNSGHSQTDDEFHLALAPGTYRLAIVVKDLAGGDIGTVFTAFDVPPYEDVRGAE
jgi:GWxTD domain-containing protein